MGELAAVSYRTTGEREGGVKAIVEREVLGSEGLILDVLSYARDKTARAFAPDLRNMFSGFLEGFLLGMVKSGYARGLRERKEESSFFDI